MKLTKETLKQIIKEEIQAVLNEEERMAVDRTDKSSVNAAAREVYKKANLDYPIDKSILDQLKKGIGNGGKVAYIYQGGKKKGINLMQYITYTN